MSSVVRQYRNLIHPGRVIRLEEKVDENSATIAQKLVEMIVSETSRRKNEAFGYTAEQVLSKIINDSSVIAILPHVLRNVNEFEIRRLLRLLPQHYFELISQDEYQDQEEYYWVNNATTSIEKCFRIAFDVAPDEVKREVAEKFVSILKEENEHMVMTYEVVFFRISDVVYLSSDETMLIKQHLFARLSKEVTVPVLVALKGVGAFLVSDEIYEFTSSIIKTILYKKDRELKDAAREFFVNEYLIMSEDCQSMVRKSLTGWGKFLEKKGQTELAKTVEEIKSSVEFEDAIPF